MPSPFDQDNQPAVPPASEWPTQPQWPAPAAHPVPPAPPSPIAPPPAAVPASAWQPTSSAPPVWQAQPGGPPMGPPPVPPASAPGPNRSGPNPARRRWSSPGSRLGLAVALVVALLVGAAGGGAAARSIFTTAADTAAPPVTATPNPSGQGSGSTGTAPTTVPDRSQSGSSGSGSSGSSSGSSGSGTVLSSWDEVSAKVNVGVVNIESRLSGGIGAGTGMVLTADGEILTNNHVVEGASQIVVTVVTTGESYRASIVGTDPEEDVAVLQLTGATGLTTIPLGDSDTVRVGDQVAAIGNAGGVGGTPSIATGRVTALGQQITASDEDGSNAETLTDMIQVDANVIPGDSGGPLANTSGEVIGMDSAAAAGAGSQGNAMRLRGSSGGGEGYAIPINKALAIAAELEKTHANAGSSSGTSSSGGYLGVQVQAGTTGGAEIVSVQNGSPAAEAGLAAGGTITAIDRTAVASPDALVNALAQHESGDQVTVTWLDTSGRSHQTDVTLAER